MITQKKNYLEISVFAYSELLQNKLSAGQIKQGYDIAPSRIMLNLKAKEHREIFLDLWKDADPGLVELEDSREKQAGLKTENP